MHRNCTQNNVKCKLWTQCSSFNYANINRTQGSTFWSLFWIKKNSDVFVILPLNLLNIIFLLFLDTKTTWPLLSLKMVSNFFTIICWRWAAAISQVDFYVMWKYSELLQSIKKWIYFYKIKICLCFFFLLIDMPICNADTCIGLSSGTAGLYKSDGKDIVFFLISNIHLEEEIKK